MRTLSLLFLLALTFGCKKSNSGDIDISAATNILLLDAQGNNLLVSPAKINVENIQVYYVKDGQTLSAYNGLMDTPKGVKVIKNQNGQEVLRVYLNTNEEEFPLTLIRFSESDTDTIKATFNRKNGSVLCSKIWHNEVLKWDVTDPQAGEEHFTIIK